MWQRRDKFDYAWPEFAGIGDQALELRELVLDYGSYEDTVTGGAAPGEATWRDTFGYTPQYSDYRWKNDVVSGEMRNIVPITSWHLAREWNAQVGPLPQLNDEFLQCTPRVKDVFSIVDPAGS